MPNGLQERGREEVRLLATGVSASMQPFEEAVARNGNALVVSGGSGFPSNALIPPTRQR
jgi:hypothetical protein